MKRILFLIFLPTLLWGQIKLSGLAEVTDFEDDTIFLISQDTSGTNNYASRRAEWDNMKSEMALEMIFAQMRAFVASDTVFRINFAGDMTLGDKSLVPIFVDNGGDVGFGTASPTFQHHILTTQLDGINIETTDGTAVGGALYFNANSSSPADNDALGATFFYGNDAGANSTQYSVVAGYSEDITEGDEAGAVSIFALLDNSLVEFIKASGYEGSVGTGAILLNPDDADIDVGIGTASPSWKLHVVDAAPITAYFESQEDGNLGGSIVMDLNSPTPADDDILGFLSYRGDDDGATNNAYSVIYAQSKDVTAANRAGGVTFDIQVNNSSLLSSDLFHLWGYNGVAGQGEIKFNEIGADIDFEIESDGIDPIIKVDAGDDTVDINGHLRIGSVFIDTTGMGRYSTFTMANGGGQWSRYSSSFVKLNNDGDVIHLLDTESDDSAYVSVTTSGALDFTNQSGSLLSIFDKITISNSGSPQLTVTGTSTSGSAKFSVSGSSTGFIVGYSNGLEATNSLIYEGDNKGVSFYTNATKRMALEADGDILMVASGVDSAFVMDETNGNIYMEGLGSGTGTQLSRVANTDQIVEETSSKEYKKYIKNWQPDPGLLMYLRPAQFTWNSKSAHPNKKDFGLIKEEVQNVLPEVIEGNMWHYGKMITYLIAVNQSQQKQINELNEQLVELRALIFKEHYSDD